MLHLDLIRCFSPGEQARAIAKTSLPYPAAPLFLRPLAPSPIPGEQPGQDLWSHKAPQFTSSCWETHSPCWLFVSRLVRAACRGAVHHTGRGSLSEEQVPLPWGRKAGIGEPGKPGLAPRAYLQSPGPEPGNAACCCAGDKPLVGREASQRQR